MPHFLYYQSDRRFRDFTNEIIHVLSCKHIIDFVIRALGTRARMRAGGQSKDSLAIFGREITYRLAVHLNRDDYHLFGALKKHLAGRVRLEVGSCLRK